jgi:hypothetical protein
MHGEKEEVFKWNAKCLISANQMNYLGQLGVCFKLMNVRLDAR